MNNPHHEFQQGLIYTKKALFSEVAKRIIEMLPDTTSIWCFGLNAISPMRLNPNDWDFIAMQPLTTPHSLVTSMNALNSPLAKIRDVRNNRVDIQALRVDEHSSFTIMLRKEGFVIWRDGRLVESDQTPLAKSA